MPTTFDVTRRAGDVLVHVILDERQLCVVKMQIQLRGIPSCGTLVFTVAAVVSSRREQELTLHAWTK